MIVLCNSVIAFENDALKIWWVRVTLYWHSLPPIPHSLSLPLLYKAIIDHIFSLDDATEPFGEQAEVTMRTNFWGTLWVCHALLPLLRPNARVVNVSSFVSKKALDTCSPQLQAKYDFHSVSKTSFILNLILIYWGRNIHWYHYTSLQPQTSPSWRKSLFIPLIAAVALAEMKTMYLRPQQQNWKIKSKCMMSIAILVHTNATTDHRQYLEMKPLLWSSHAVINYCITRSFFCGVLKVPWYWALWGGAVLADGAVCYCCSAGKPSGPGVAKHSLWHNKGRVLSVHTTIKGNGQRQIYHTVFFTSV